MLTIHLAQLAQDLLAAPTPTPSGPAPAPAKVGFNFDGIGNVLKYQIGPIILTVLGLGIASRAAKGDWAKTLTTSAIAIVGILFIAGGITLMAAGPWLVNLIFN